MATPSSNVAWRFPWTGALGVTGLWVHPPRHEHHLLWEGGVYHESKENDLWGGLFFNTPERKAIPQTSRNHLHLSVSESDLHLLGTATDELLRLWFSPSRPDEYTYKCKRHSMQMHINGVLQTGNLYFEKNKTDYTVVKNLQFKTKSIIKIKHKSINLTRFLHLSPVNLNLTHPQ